MSQPDLGALSGVLNQLLGGGTANGLSSLTEKLKAQGLDREVDSWIGPGENQPVAPERLGQALGPQFGGGAASLIAMLLPVVVNALTPQGRLPQHDSEMPQGGLDGLLGQLTQGQGAGGLAAILAQMGGQQPQGGLAGILGGLLGGRR